MAEVLVEFTDPVVAENGKSYLARACGDEMAGGHWQGWIEFIPVADGEPVRSGRETTQPNRRDTLYWATGLTAVYLEGALHRALHPLTRPPAREAPKPVFDGPAPPLVDADPNVDSILNPFSVYRKGETLLRRQLGALSSWHLVNIITQHRLSRADSATLNGMDQDALIELIVQAVKSTETGIPR